MATRNEKPTTGRLSEIVAYRRSQGSGVAGSLVGGIKERLKEKFDPRQLINQKGLMTALFPGLKTYQSKTTAKELSKSSMQSASFDEIKPILETISFNTKMTAKNTMVLPALHRDVNVIRQNIVKLVKMKGGDARTKADMYFTKAKDREDKYERELKKEQRNKNQLTKKEETENEGGFLKKIISAIIGGLEAIVKGIVGLGKVIIGTFKLLGELIFSIISTISSFIFNSLLGLGGLLKSLNIKDLFKNFLSRNFIKFLFGIMFRGIVGFLLGAAGIKIFIRKLAFPLAALLLSAEGLKSFLQRRQQEGEITLEEERELFRNNDLGGKQRFPESNVFGEEFEEYKRLGLVDPKVGALAGISGKSTGGYLESRNQNEKYTAQQTYDKNILYEYEEGKRNLYTLKVPGITTNHSLFLDKKEATDWGDNTRKYKAIIDKLIEVKEGKVSLTENQLGNLYDAYSSSRNKLLDLYEKYVKENLKDGTDVSNILQNIEMSRKREKEDFFDIFGRNLMEDIFNPLSELVVPKEIPDFFGNAANTVSSLRNSGLTFLSETGESARKTAHQANADMREYLSKQLEQLTSDNRNVSSEVIGSPVVINNTTNNTSTSPNTQQEEPASAYNLDFINNYNLNRDNVSNY